MTRPLHYPDAAQFRIYRIEKRRRRSRGETSLLDTYRSRHHTPLLGTVGTESTPVFLLVSRWNTDNSL